MRANHAPAWLCMKLLKSKSLGVFQSGMAGSLTTIGSSIIVFWSMFPYVSNPYTDLPKSSGSSIIMPSDCQLVRDSAVGSNAPVFMNPFGIIAASCLIGATIWDCRGNGLCIGGVGGALCRAKGSESGTVLVVGVPP